MWRLPPVPAFRSLQGRLVLLWIMVVAASVTAGLLMVALFRQSTAAQVDRAEVVIQRGCDAISKNYQFYLAGWKGGLPPLDDPALRQGMTNVVQSALRDQPGVEGGMWQSEAGSLAYAYPTYEGSGPKIDLPVAELDNIHDINYRAATDEISRSRRIVARSQTLLLHACPLAGVIPQLTAWTMTRVATATGEGFSLLRLGLGVLLACVVGAAALLTHLLSAWARHVAQIEAALARDEHADLPALSPTGERDLDRIVLALNQAGTRLAETRRQSEAMSRQMASAERLAAIGRMTAAFAHEIRNPIAAMRLKAENALASDPVEAGKTRRRTALTAIIEQIARLDHLVEQLLRASHRKEPKLQWITASDLLERVVSTHQDIAVERGVTLATRCDLPGLKVDPEMVQRALDNLVGNAVQHTRESGKIVISAERRNESLIIRVRDDGPGIPAALRATVFEPFVTGRANGTGLGLSIAREAVESHGGHIRLMPSETGACFEIELPWQPS